MFAGKPTQRLRETAFSHLLIRPGQEVFRQLRARYGLAITRDELVVPQLRRAAMSQMPPLRYKSVVILEDEKLSASDLADRFRALGAAVHVVSRSGHVETLVRNKRVDIVVRRGTRHK